MIIYKIARVYYGLIRKDNRIVTGYSFSDVIDQLN